MCDGTNHFSSQLVNINSYPITAGMIEDRIAEMGLELPSPPKAAGSYIPVIVDEDMVYVSGQIPLQAGTVPDIFKGKVTSIVSIEDAQHAARVVPLMLFHTLNLH